MQKTYRLIWFQHFHKAAGTSIVRAAQKNNEVFWHKHLNANPLAEDGQVLELWRYDASELTDFVDQCEQSGVTFVATEWGVPLMSCLQMDDRVVSFTCIRDPLSRYVSNFYFDLYNGFTPARSLPDYENTRRRTITMFDYYTRMLSQQYNCEARMTQADQKKAMRALQHFDFCIYLDEGLDKLRLNLGWKLEAVEANKNDLSLRQAISLVVRLKWKLLWLRLCYKRGPASVEFEKYFKENNQADIQLYNER